MAKDDCNRQVILINKPFQLSIVGFFTFLAFLTIIIFYAAMWRMFDHFIQEGKMLGLPDGHAFYAYLQEQLSTLNLFFGITSAVILATFVIGGLYLSHRVAGPIYRFCQMLDEMSEEHQAHPISFRQKDYFPELAEKFNQFLKETKK